MSDDLDRVRALIAEAAEDGLTKVTLPLDLAQALLARASRSGRPRISRGLRIRESGWVHLARMMKQQWIDEGVPAGEAHERAAQWLSEQFNQVGKSRPLGVSTCARMIAGDRRR